MSVADLEKRLTPAGDIAQLHEALAAMTHLPAPSRPSAAGVADLFDRYAEAFDDHLRERLGYRPELIEQAVRRFKPNRPLDVLDLGCGTGLCGVLLRPLAGTLAGVDLSPGIVEKARERGIYDSLAVGDLVEALRAAPRSFDLLTAGDVLVYLGDLAPTFEAAAAALRLGGLFVLTVEAGDGDRYEWNRATKRYQHSRPYLEHLAGICGFGVLAVEAVITRTDAGKPVAGFLVVLELR
jgi:predicted TPR repeat methyltransferase